MNEKTITPLSPLAPSFGEKGREDVRIAIFPGSFDPFTIGHADIVRRALPLFDRIVIAVGYNAAKVAGTPIAERVAAIERIYAAETRVTVKAYSGLTADLASRENAQFLLRGVRSVKDFEYERDMAAVNADISGVETVFLMTNPRYAHISSSVVRELQANGHDVTSYLP